MMKKVWRIFRANETPDDIRFFGENGEMTEK
jgi:hypothetical protein